MKKKVLALLMAVVMIAACVIIATPEASATDPHDNDHCVCGGDAVGKTGHNCADYVNVTWNAWPTGNAPTEGYYYLTANTVLTPVAVGETGTAGINLTGDLYICLNGFKLSTDADWVFTTTVTSTAGQPNTKLVICDCDNGGSVENTSTTSTKQGAIATHQSVNQLLDVTIFDGTFSAACKRGKDGSTQGGGMFFLKSSASGTKGAKPFTVITIYGGTFTNGSSEGDGGLIFINGHSELYIHGGTFTNGHSDRYGGLIRVGHKNATCTITGGTFSNGTSGVAELTSEPTAGAGGLVSVAGAVTITGGSFSNGTAKQGGLIYATLGGTISNVTFANGSAQEGENFYIHSSGKAAFVGVAPEGIYGPFTLIGKITLSAAEAGLGIQVTGNVDDLDTFSVKLTLEGSAVAEHTVELFNYNTDVDLRDDDGTFTIWLKNLIGNGHGNEKLTVAVYADGVLGATYTTSMSALIAEAATMDNLTPAQSAALQALQGMLPN